MKYFLIGFTCLFLSLSSFSTCWAAGGGGEDNSSSSPEDDNTNYINARKALQSGNYQKAIAALLSANEEVSDNANILNLLGYSYRKTKNYDMGLKYYLLALEIEPKHRDANEYLGELYLQMGKLNKAEGRLEVLDKDCFFGCEQYDELKEAIKKYKKRNDS